MASGGKVSVDCCNLPSDPFHRRGAEIAEILEFAES